MGRLASPAPNSRDSSQTLSTLLTPSFQLFSLPHRLGVHVGRPKHHSQPARGPDNLVQGKSRTQGHTYAGHCLPPQLPSPPTTILKAFLGPAPAPQAQRAQWQFTTTAVSRFHAHPISRGPWSMGSILYLWECLLQIVVPVCMETACPSCSQFCFSQYLVSSLLLRGSPIPSTPNTSPPPVLATPHPPALLCSSRAPWDFSKKGSLGFAQNSFLFSTKSLAFKTQCLQDSGD